MIAISSDVHGEADTFEACLDHARSRGATEHWLLGDIVSGTHPDRSACLARQRCTVVVAGNHDMAVSRTGPSYIAHGEWDAVHGLELVERTRTALDVDQHAWLAGLPHQHVTDDAHCTHATAWSPIDFLETVDEVAAHSILADRRLAFVGHHHELFPWKWQDVE